MKKLTVFSIGLAAALVVPAAFADETTTTTRTSDDETKVEETKVEKKAEMPPTSHTTQSTTTYVGGGPVVQPPARDTVVVERERETERTRVHPGIGLNVFGAVGSTDASRVGLGGRLEFVMPFGLTLGGSYTQHFVATGNSADTSAVRPLLGEIGVAIPVAPTVELRPMVGIGYAFVNASSSGSGTPPGNGATASTSVQTSGFDVAPGAKISYIDKSIEVFTMPKYHIIKDMNFFGMELGAGARF